MAPLLAPAPSVAARFSRWARPLRRRLLARRVVAGATVGLLIGVGVAAAAWWFRLGEGRALSAGLGLIGGAVGAWLARRQRWTDTAVALYLDQQLDSHEAIVTALELEGGDADPPAYAAVIEQAHTALSQQPPEGMWPRVWRRWHAAAPVALAAIVGLALIQLPPAPATAAPPPGSDSVALTNPSGLDKVIQLAELRPLDAAKQQRLEELSKRAAKLRKQLREGMAKRLAQAEVAKLREDVAAERQRFGSGEQRRGLEAAMAKMAQHNALREAQKALGDRDLNAFDDAMKKLANKLEAEDRAAARAVLGQAAKAARARGAEGVAKAIEEQQRLLDERGQRADTLKQLAKAMGDGLPPKASEALKQAAASGDPQAMKELAEALAEAMAQLSDEERERLAKRLQAQAKQAPAQGSPGDNGQQLTKEQLQAMLDQLSSDAGRQALAQQLRQLANSPASPSAQQQQSLRNAEQGLADTAQQLAQQGQKGAGKPGAGAGKPGAGQPGAGKPGGAGRGGISRGGGPGDHAGHTDRVNAQRIRAKANARMNAGAPNASQTQGRAPGRVGETANRRGSGALGTVGPGEVGALEHSEVPEEYRQQVGRYFEP